ARWWTTPSACRWASRRASCCSTSSTTAAAAGPCVRSACRAWPPAATARKGTNCRTSAARRGCVPHHGGGSIGAGPFGVARLFRAIFILVALALAKVGGANGSLGSNTGLTDADREMLLVSACAGQRAYSAPVAWRDEASRRLRSGLDCLTTRRFDGREVVR